MNSENLAEESVRFVKNSQFTGNSLNYAESVALLILLVICNNS